MEPTVSVVIPAKNEALNLPHVFAGLQHDLHEVILVDGDSTDETVEVARQLRPDIIVVNQTRKGKGNALACGFQVASGDFIVMLDADGSTDPAEIPRFVNALKEGADFAKGSRFMPG
ncbi:MAG: glycosyltransferase family 2 protein, partial [Acidimicrobiales bacterium]